MLRATLVHFGKQYGRMLRDTLKQIAWQLEVNANSVLCCTQQRNRLARHLNLKIELPHRIGRCFPYLQIVRAGIYHEPPLLCFCGGGL